MNFHPASLLFPMMSDAELNELADDIKKNGLIEPVVLYHGEVLDGRNRLKACEMAGVEPKFTETNGDVPSPTLYALSKNMHRRHLSTSQRAAIGAEMLPMLREEAHRRQVEAGTANLTRESVLINTDSSAGRSREIAAQAVGASSDTIERASAIKNANPEAFEKIKRGELTVNAARNGHLEQPKLPGGSQPISITTERGKQIATKQKRNMTDGLATIGGICWGLERLKFDMVAAVCSDEEIESWATKAETHARELKKFAANMRRRNGESTQSA